MTNTTVITALGKEIGVESGVSFDVFRGKARSFLMRHTDTPAESPVQETLRTVSKIINDTRGNKFEDKKSDPWETVVHTVLFGEIKKRHASTHSNPASRNTDEETAAFFEQQAKENAKIDLQRHLHTYRSTLDNNKALFQRESVMGLRDKKRAVTQDLHDYRTALDRLRNLAQILFERQTEISNAKTARETTREKNITDVNALSSRYEIFLKDHAKDISKHITALDNNPLVLELIRRDSSAGGRLSSLFVGADDNELKKNLNRLKEKLDNSIGTGFLSALNPKSIRINSLVIKGKDSIDNLLTALDKQQAAQGIGLLALHKSFYGDTIPSEANMAIWDACFGVVSADKVRNALNQTVAGLRSRNPSEATRQIANDARFFIDQSFHNNYERLEGFTPEQKALFRDLNAISQTQPTSPHGVKSGFNYTVHVDQKMIDNLIPALQDKALEEAERNYVKLDRTTEERIASMQVGPCPFTAFEKENKAFIDQVVAHINSTSANAKTYIDQAKKLHDELRDKIRKMSTIDTGRRGPVAPPPSAASTAKTATL